MSSSCPRDHRSSVDTRPLTGGDHGDNKSCSSGIVALDLSDKLPRICHQRWAKIQICLTHCGGFVMRGVGKKWRCSNAVIPTLRLMCLYSSLTTLFPPEILSPITIHKATEPRMKGMRLVINSQKSKLQEFDLKAKFDGPYISSLRFLQNNTKIIKVECF